MSALDDTDVRYDPEPPLSNGLTHAPGSLYTNLRSFPSLSWQPIIFSASSHVHSKSCAQSHALSRGQSPDRSHDTSRDTSRDLPTQHWSHDMMSQSRRF